MSVETDAAVDIDYDSLIEYCPESLEDQEVNCSPPAIEDQVEIGSESEAPPPRIISVCALCYRQYDLKEDLRGHMIEYHKYVPIGSEKKPAEKSAAKDLMEKKQQLELKEKTQVVEIPVVQEPQESLEIKPMPFKDFRLILRRQMHLKCTAGPGCVYKFETEENRQHHLKCHLDNIMSFKCYLCSIALNNWRRCSAHLWKAHKADIDLLKCPVCEFKSHASALVWRHMRVHKKWRPRVMRSLKAVKQKRLAQQTASKPEEDRPKQSVRKNRYYSEKTCEICDRKFVNGKTLSKHIKTVHNKIKPFICNVCGKKSARKASLNIHMRQHTGLKPLHCKSCKFATRDPSVLHKHQMRHSGAVKLKCSLCDFSCIQANAYKHHMRLNHSESYKKISCDLCSFVTVNEEKLKAHKEDHRKGLIRNNEDSMSARKVHKSNETSADCFLPLESIDSLPHEPAVDTGGVTIPAPSEDSQFPTYFTNN